MSSSIAVAVGGDICDKTLHASVGQQLRASPYSGVRDVKFEIKGGHVALQGTVSSWHLKQLASETTRRIPGVKRVCLAGLEVAPI